MPDRCSQSKPSNSSSRSTFVRSYSVRALPYLARYPLALVLHRKDGVTPGTVAKLHSWLHNVQGHALPFAQTARLYPEFTPEKVAEEFLKWL